MQTIELKFPDELLSLAGFQKETLSHDALKMIVLELYREETISLGKAAELSGESIEEFMKFSSSRFVPLHYGESELHEDREQMKRIFA